MKAIICQNAAGYIGHNGGLLWQCKDDLQHFQRLTLGLTLLVGYNTYTSLPKLKNRTLIVDNRHALIDFEKQGIDWCIGGKETYEKYAPFFTELHISIIENDYQIGDTPAPNWQHLNPNCIIYHYKFQLPK